MAVDALKIKRKDWCSAVVNLNHKLHNLTIFLERSKNVKGTYILLRR